MKIEAFHGNNRTFRHVELVPLGENLDEDQREAAADDVAEFLYCSAIGDQSLPVSQGDIPSAINVTVQQLGAANKQFLEHFASEICLELLDTWRGRELGDRNTASFTQPHNVLK